MGFTWGYRSKSRKKKKSLSGPVTNGEATIDGNLLGSNDEKFFDTTESLASDYDEFYSAKGDSTPSCEGTPRSRLSTSDPPNKDPSIAPITTLNSDCYPRKNLSAFLQEESVDDDESDSSTTDDGNLDNEEENRSTERGFKHPPHPSEVAAGENSTGSKLQSTPEVNTKRKSKSQRGMNCCLPCRPGGTKSVGE